MSLISLTTGFISSYTKNLSNYSIINKNNLYNFFISLMEGMTAEQNEEFIKNMKINLGMTIYNQFKQYIFTKVSNSPLLEFFK
jgi:hypothetical protein